MLAHYICTNRLNKQIRLTQQAVTFGMSTFKVALAVVALSIALPASAFAGDANQGGSGGSGTNIQSDGAMSGQTTMKSHKKYVKKSAHKKPMNHSM
jgi:hypothetical protein